MIAAAEIGIEPCRQHLCEHPHRRAAATHPAHEARVQIPGRVGCDERGKDTIDLVELGRLPRQAFIELGANRLGNWLPHWTLANCGKIVDHVVEHAMTERSDLAPLLRIERLAWHALKRALARRSRHAACSRATAARRSSIVAKAWKILRICGDLYGKISDGSILWTTAVLSASNTKSEPSRASAQSTVK